MWRASLYIVKLAILIAIIVWVADRPGTVSIEWLGYRIDTSVGILLIAVFLVAAVAALAYRLWLGLRRSPRQARRALISSRRRRGYKALTRGMVAVAAGDADEARRSARRADALLDEPPLTMLLSAQAAQLQGDEAAAERYFTAMLDNEETRFLGLRGLLMRAMRTGNQSLALDYARQAYEIRPQTPWVHTTLFDLNLRLENLDGAKRALENARKYKAMPAAEANSKRAAILVEQARSCRAAGQTDRSLELAREAHKLRPDLIPATILFAELLVANGRQRKAARMLERGWARMPHPGLVAPYMAAYPSAAGVEKVKRVGKLVGTNSTHPESRVALARAAIDARLWGEARRHLSAATAGNSSSEGICRLMAQLEEAENGDGEAARKWLLRAIEAPPDPAWVCETCGAATETWHARCEVCGAFDSARWQTPKRAVPAAIEIESAAAQGRAAELALPSS